MPLTTMESGVSERLDITEPTLLIEPDFIANPNALYEHLARSIAWDERMKARKTATFGRAYNYSDMTYPDSPMPDELAAIVAKLNEQIGLDPNNCLLNYYENGDSTMGFHADSTIGLEPGTGVAIVSLGAERSITFRHQRHRSVWFHYPLANGSLLYMSADIQSEWHHAIRRQENVGGRISLTFRQLT